MFTDCLKGLNRGKDDIANTIAAAKVAKDRMKNLLAIELGNEPECRFSLSSQLFDNETTSDHQQIILKTANPSP